MIVTWIAIQSQPFPWVEQRTDLAYVACGENTGELSLVRTGSHPESPSIDRLLESLELKISVEKTSAKPSLDWLRKAMPDQGTSIRLSAAHRCQTDRYEEQIERLASRSS